MYIEAFVDGLGVSTREIEVKSDFKDFGLSNGGIVMNLNGERCERRKDQEFSFGFMRREMFIRYFSGGDEWVVRCMNLEFKREFGLEIYI